MRNSSYFDITREPQSEAEIQQLLAQGQSAVRRGNSRGFFAQTVARRKAGFAAGSRRDRPDGHRLRGFRDEFAVHDGFEPRSDRAAGEIARHRPAVQSGDASALQSRSHHAIQHRARPDGRGADDDDGHHHRRWPSRANAKAARWKICFRRRCVRAKSSSAKSCLTFSSVTCRCF